MTTEQAASLEAYLLAHNLIRPDQTDQYLEMLSKKSVPFHVFSAGRVVYPFERQYASTDAIPELARRMIAAGLLHLADITNLVTQAEFEDVLTPEEIALFFPTTGRPHPLVPQVVEHFRKNEQRSHSPAANQEKWIAKIELQQALDYFVYLLFNLIKNHLGISDLETQRE